MSSPFDYQSNASPLRESDGSLYLTSSRSIHHVNWIAIA